MSPHDSSAHEPEEDQPMPEPGVVEHDLVEPVAVGPGDPHGPAAAPAAPPSHVAPSNGASPDAADASLLALVDRLTAMLERSELGELEVSTGGTTIILRSPSAIERSVAVTAAPALEVGIHPSEASVPAEGAAAGTASATATTVAPAKPSVRAPLTGLFYGAVGDHVSVGQIIGLIEAMKLFNEIKSDLAGRVVRVCADNGALVKAKQPLIEVEPA
jgi:acetyl-CoA carboxylase biotin carboxyl carrier protein